MSTSFTPPSPDQWQGPAGTFTPPPVSSWQGPAPSEQVTSSIRYLATPDYQPPAELSPIAKTGQAFAQGLGLPALMDILRASDRYGTPEEIAARGDRAKAALQGIAQGIAGEPGRVWGELSRTGESMLKGDLSGTAYHLAGAVPFVGGPAQQVAMDLQRGDPAAAVGHTGALIAPFVAGPVLDATGQGIAATGRGIATAGTAARGAARGMAQALPTATEAAVEKSIYGALGGPAGMVAAAKIAAAKELGKGAITGARSALAERTAQAAAATAQEAPAGGMGVLSPDYYNRLQLPPGPVVTPPPADTSFVRSVPAQYPDVEPGFSRSPRVMSSGEAAQLFPEAYGQPPAAPPFQPRGLLPAAPNVIVPEAPPPPPDTSFVRSVPAQYPDVIPPALRSNAPAADAAMSLRDLMRESGTLPPETPPPATEAPAAPEASNPFEVYARKAKAQRLAKTASESGLTAQDAHDMITDATARDAFTRAVHEDSVSPQTMAMIEDELRKLQPPKPRTARKPQ